MATIPAGTWVEIERVLLRPEERAPSLPQETRKCPYILNLSGFLLEPGELGAEVKIRTMIGRQQTGMLRRVNPSYDHSFGTIVPELLDIGQEEQP